MVSAQAESEVKQMNSINLMGRITADIELKSTQSGKSVCTFTIAVKRPNVKDKTDFLNCLAWEKNAENISRYFGKGKMIALRGVLESRTYEDKDGKKRTVHEVEVREWEFCESKGDAKNETPISEANFEEIGDDDTLPF